MTPQVWEINRNCLYADLVSVNMTAVSHASFGRAWRWEGKGNLIDMTDGILNMRCSEYAVDQNHNNRIKTVKLTELLIGE